MITCLRILEIANKVRCRCTIELKNTFRNYDQVHFKQSYTTVLVSSAHVYTCENFSAHTHMHTCTHTHTHTQWERVNKYQNKTKQTKKSSICYCSCAKQLKDSTSSDSDSSIQ